MKRFLTCVVLTVVLTGCLHLVLAPNSPDSSLLPAGTNGLTVMSVTMVAEEVPLEVSGLKVYIKPLNNGGPDQIEQLTIYHGAQLIATAVPVTSDSSPESEQWPGYIPFQPGPITFDPIQVTMDEATKLTFKVDTSQVDPNIGVGESGQGFALFVPGAEIVVHDVETGTKLVGMEDVESNEFYLYQSVPVIEFTANGDYHPNACVEEINLCAVNVTADSSGDIGLGRLKFGINTENLSLSDVVLYDSYNQPVGQAVNPDATPGQIVVTFLDEGPLTVPAGATKRLRLRARVTREDCSQPAALNIRLLSDSKAPEIFPGWYNEVAYSPTDGNLVWTDFNQSGPLQQFDPEVFNRPQWTTGHLVRNPGGDLLTSEQTVYFYWD